MLCGITPELMMHCWWLGIGLLALVWVAGLAWRFYEEGRDYRRHRRRLRETGFTSKRRDHG